MKRYAAYDPPEYLDWSPDPEIMAEYQAVLDRDPERRGLVEELGAEGLLGLYAGLLRFRLHDVALKRWVRQGVISKAWLGTGEEATTIGPVHALERLGADGDVVGPMIRNAGACHEMGMPVSDMLRAYLATEDSPNRGRDLHISSRRFGIAGPISMVGALAPVIAGYGLAFRLGGERRVALTWIGDGATKTGVAHEALNFTAVQRLPVIYIIQDNRVALGTLPEDYHRPGDYKEFARAYGAPTDAFDGNHVLDAYAATRIAAQRCRRGDGPVFLTAATFRMGGHATHDEREARELFSSELFEHWGRRDPIGCYEAWLIDGDLDLESGERVGRGGAADRNREILGTIEMRIIEEVDRAAEAALDSRSSAMPAPESAANEVYDDWPETASRWPASLY